MLSELRASKNMTQEELACKVCVSRSAVAMWETGAQLPRADKLPQLAEILGCSIDELMAALQSKGERKEAAQ